jgi:type IV pilus assembly protein PilE
MLSSARRKAYGLTLIELMVVVAVLAILTTIGIPMYNAQVEKARRSDARSGVMEIAMVMEQEFAAWGGYSEPDATITGVVAANSTPAPDANSNFNDNLTRVARQYSDFYTFTITVPDGDDSTFTVRAAPTGSQADDTKCAFLEINQLGAKSATDADLCW